MVRLPDRRELLAYLNGETNTAPNIDKTVPVDISIRRAVSRGPLDVQSLRRCKLPNILNYHNAYHVSIHTFDFS